MNRHLRVEGNPSLVRDTKTGAIINKDDYSRQEYETKRAKARQKRHQDAELSARVAKVENDLSEIKYLLQRLLDKQ